MFFKVGVLKNFAIFTGKHLKAGNYFPTNISTFLRTDFFCRTPPVAAFIFSTPISNGYFLSSQQLGSKSSLFDNHTQIFFSLTHVPLLAFKMSEIF